MAGRSPSGPRSRATHRAASASSPKASIPNAGIWDRLRNLAFRTEYMQASVTEQLASQVRGLRISRGVSVAELAEKLDCSIHDIEAIESGSADSEIDLLLKIAAAFDVALLARFVPFSQALGLNGYIPSITEQLPTTDERPQSERTGA